MVANKGAGHIPHNPHPTPKIAEPTIKSKLTL